MLPFLPKVGEIMGWDRGSGTWNVGRYFDFLEERFWSTMAVVSHIIQLSLPFSMILFVLIIYLTWVSLGVLLPGVMASWGVPGVGVALTGSLPIWIGLGSLIFTWFPFATHFF